MAVTVNQTTSRKEARRKAVPVAASTKIYDGTLVFTNASGYGDDDTNSGANKFAGVAAQECDNSAGANADKSVETHLRGAFLLTGSGFTQATVGQRIYATDNYTITATATTSGAVLIGICTEYVSSTKVWVEICVEGDDAAVLDSLTLNGDLTFAETQNIIVGTTTGSEIGTAAAQKLGFWGATPVVQQSHITDAPGDSAANNATTINSILTALETVGILAAS